MHNEATFCIILELEKNFQSCEPVKQDSNC